MKSAPRGKRTSVAEVTNVSRHGFWLFVAERELFVPFDEFPWFRDAPVGQIVNVEQQGPNHLHWPDLDVDLAVESIEQPAAFPLISKRSNKALQPTSRARKPTRKRSRSRAARG